MIEFCILGSGMAGSTIANLLSKKSSVEIFDKARGAGGRSSNRRFKNGASFDHGLQYIYPKNKLFKRFLINLERKKIIKKWEGNHLDLTLRVKRPGYKYIGKKGNSDIQKYLVKNISTNYKSSIDKIIYKKDHWVILVNNKFYRCRNLILTCPYPQMLTLARKYLKKNLLKEKIVMQPNITAMIAIKKDYNIPVSSIRFKNKTNGGRAYVFYQHGIPVIHDLSPSSFDFMGRTGEYICGHDTDSYFREMVKLTNPDTRNRISKVNKDIFERDFNAVNYCQKLVEFIDNEVTNE